jgi:hypothetical protein
VVASRIRKNKKKKSKRKQIEPVGPNRIATPTNQASPARRPIDATPVPRKTIGESRSAATPPQKPKPKDRNEQTSCDPATFLFFERHCVLLATTTITHVYRSCNTLAHDLAGFGRDRTRIILS